MSQKFIKVDVSVIRTLPEEEIPTEQNNWEEFKKFLSDQYEKNDKIKTIHSDVKYFIGDEIKEL